MTEQVYLISAEARCARLADAMMITHVVGDGFSPPPPPPLSDLDVVASAPPPSPPRPRLPSSEDARVVYQSPHSTTLSTYFLGGLGTVSGLGNKMGLTSLGSTREYALQRITDSERSTWAECSTIRNVLPCRTGDLPERCIHGAEQCGTTEENTRAPWVELDLHDGKPTDRDYYFFALEVSLPSDPELGALFFRTAQGVSEDRGDVTNRFYKLEVFDTHHNPLPTQCKPYFKQSVDFYTAGMTHFQYVCLEALAEDEDYVVMRDVRYVRLTLLGEYRMLWITGMRVLWRTLQALPPTTPPPPPTPPVPPRPNAPPDAPAVARVCHEYTALLFDYPVAFKEPCGLTAAQCCVLAYDHNHTAAYHLSPSGCCTLLNVPEADHPSLAAATLTPSAINPNSPPVVKVSGARVVV